MKPQAFVEQLHRDNKAWYGDDRGRGALSFISVAFPQKWLYVAELVQNALDEGATSLRFSVDASERLVVEHNGHAFGEADIRGICMQGLSNKGISAIGFMGIGFKALFHSYEQVTISSDVWRVTLRVPVKVGTQFNDRQRDWLGAVLPVWAEDAPSPSEGMTCRFILERRLKDLDSIANDLAHVLGENTSVLGLLGKRGIRELNWNGEKWSLTAKTEGRTTHVFAEAPKAAKHHEWVIFAQEYTPDADAVRRFLEHRRIDPPEPERAAKYKEASRSRTVELFCQLDGEGSPLLPEKGIAFALLPTEQDLPIRLHLQADWLLDVTRRGLMQLEDDPWHLQILDQVPALLRCYLTWLVDNARLTPKGRTLGYEALPDFKEAKGTNWNWFLQPRFRIALANELRALKFLPLLAGLGGQKYISPDQARALPSPLLESLDKPEYKAAELFGHKAISRSLLGDRAWRCISDLQLIVDMDPAELVGPWRAGAVGRWLDCMPEKERAESLHSLLSALRRLDSQKSWQQAPLACLPTEGKTWATRASGKRFPPDWDSVPVEIQELLLPFIGERDALVLWSLDRELQRRTKDDHYLAVLTPPLLDVARRVSGTKQGWN